MIQVRTADRAKVMQRLREAGLGPHAHIIGLLNAENTLAFPNAEVLVPSVEWKYFMDDGEMAKQTGERMP